MAAHSPIAKASWYWNRLRSMSVPEVLHRFGERTKQSISRYTKPRFDRSAYLDEPLPAIPGLTEGVAAVGSQPDVVVVWREIFERARTGRWSFLGLEWPGVTGPEKWRVDPQTGNLWPAKTYCYDIPYRHARNLGDVKYVWELNRLQYLQPIAALAMVTRDREAALFCVGELESWIDNNPPFDGVGWASGIELGVRIVSIAVVTTLLGDGAFSTEQRRKIMASLAAHGYWLDRYPSKFSSSNNHLVAEAAGLYVLGRLMPALPEATRYAAYGRFVLARECELQIFADGVGAEQSPTYEAFTIEWLLLCCELAKRLGEPFNAQVLRRLAAAGEFLRWLTDAAGNQPLIGDDDEGRVLYSGEEAPSYTTSILSCVAAVLDRPDLTPPGWTYHFRHGFFGTPKAPLPGPRGVRRFEPGGYTIVRGGGDKPSLLVVDHGPLGYLSIAAHGHADALAFWLHIGDQPVIVDAGTYLYHAGGAWRDHFRGTSAHNTLCPDGRDSSQITGNFNWGRKADVFVQSFDDTEGAWHVEAWHNGYEAASGARHIRRYEALSGNGFRIIDTLSGHTGQLPVEVGFLIHPDLTVLADQGHWVIGDGNGALVSIIHESPLQGVLQRGSDDPIRGWYSPRFGEKIPASRLAFSGSLLNNQLCLFDVHVHSR